MVRAAHLRTASPSGLWLRGGRISTRALFLDRVAPLPVFFCCCS
jgi:hypothetical protein